MALNVIGAGVGRTGTYSLKLALEQLGFGPCHHMEEVIKNPPLHIPLWNAAAQGKPDWETAYKGYNSAVDWPTASFWRELAGIYPYAKIILTVRSPESWQQSFSETIQKLMTTADQAPPQMRPFLDMVSAVLARAGFIAKLGRDDIIKAFNEHADAVKRSIAPERLLVYEVKDGWEPLCAFLGKPIPAEPFPRTNNREDFWERLKNPPQ